MAAGPPSPILFGAALLLMAIRIAPAFAQAEPAGPPRPAPPPRNSPAEQAIAAYRAQYGSAAVPAPCIRRRDEITVCAYPAGRSPDRLPLPDERQIRHAGEFNHVDIGTGPVPTKPGMTVARFGMSKAARERNATLKLIYAQDRAKEEKAAAEKAAEQPHVIGP